MDPLNYQSFYATCTNIFLRRISVYWMIRLFQLSRTGYAPANRNFQHCKSQLSTLQIATFNIANGNFQDYKSQLIC